MDSASILPFLIVSLCVVLLGYPIVRILKRVGYSAWWVILAFILDRIERRLDLAELPH
jgi:hypothetical protein